MGRRWSRTRPPAAPAGPPGGRPRGRRRPGAQGPATMVMGDPSSGPSASRASASAAVMRPRRSRLAASMLRHELRDPVRVVLQQQQRRVEGVPHPAQGVDARRQRERHGLRADTVGRHARGYEQRGQPGTAAVRQQPQPDAGDGPVLTLQRHHVRDGPDGRQVREAERERRAVGRVRQQQLGDLERDTRTRQPRVRIAAVGAMGIDDRRRIRWATGQLVMVGDDDRDAQRPRPRRSRRGWSTRCRRSG